MPKDGKNGKARVGIIGCVGIATSSHAPSLKQLQEEGLCDVVACADVNEAAAQFGIPRAFTDFRDLLALDEVDGVTVATPPFVHRDATVAALRAGKHVLCEKPMAMNVTQAKEMLAVSKETGKVLTIGHGGRFSAQAQRIHEHVAAGDLGEIYYAKTAALRKRGVPSRGVFTVKRLNGGGPLIDIGVHALDLTLWLMGNPRPVGVYAATYDKLAHRPGIPEQNSLFNWGPFDPAKYDVEDLCAGFVRFENGASLFLDTSWLLNQKEDEVRQTNIYGTAGAASTSPFQILLDPKGTALEDVTPDLPSGREASQGNFLRFQRFVECILGRAEPLVTAEEALNVQRIIDGLYQSAETGKLVEVS